MTLAISSADNILANLSGNLLGHRPAHLSGHVAAGLSGHLDGNLTGHLAALLPWDSAALLPGHGGALLLGHGGALLPGNGSALLLGDGVADGLRDGPGSVDTLRLGNRETPLLGDEAGLLDRPVVADTPDLCLAPRGGTNNLGIGLTLAESPHSTESSKSGISWGSNGRSSSNGSTTDGRADNRLYCDLALNSNKSSLGTLLQN